MRERVERQNSSRRVAPSLCLCVLVQDRACLPLCLLPPAPPAHARQRDGDVLAAVLDLCQLLLMLQGAQRAPRILPGWRLLSSCPPIAENHSKPDQPAEDQAQSAAHGAADEQQQQDP